MSDGPALIADPAIGPLVSAYGYFDASKQTLMYYDSEEAVAMNASNYSNHSREPNLKAGWYDGVYCLVAKKDIAIVENVTYDYREATTGPEWVDDFECRCQSPNCIHRDIHRINDG